MKFLLSILFLFYMHGCSSAPHVKSDSKPVSHKIWDNLLKKHVKSNGLVNYKGFVKDSTQLNRYLNLLAAHHPNKQHWSKKQRIAYWINAYNAFTIQLVIRHYPIESIKDIVNGISLPRINSPWQIEFILIEDQEYNLDDIEHKILRKKYNEPRIHFAVNCASISCPPLRKEAFTANKLDQQLEEQISEFINNPEENRITRSYVKISRIFKWFSGDFKVDGSIIPFLNRYSSIKITPDAKIDYMDYSWTLNDTSGH